MLDNTYNCTAANPGLLAPSGTPVLSKILYECTITSNSLTIGDGSKAWNSIANDWTVSGTGLGYKLFEIIRLDISNVTLIIL